MQLFLKVLKSLFKIVLSFSIAVATTLTDILLKIECLLIGLDNKLYPKPFVSKEDYLNQLREEYKKENSRKEGDVD
jgi:hypothetical protein